MEQRKAIVVYKQQDAIELRSFVAEGVYVATPFSAICARRFDHIVIACDLLRGEALTERVIVRNWYWDSLMTSLAPGGAITWLTRAPLWAYTFNPQPENPA